MKKVWLFILLLIPSITLAQMNTFCGSIDSKEHEEVLHQFYDLLIVGGYRAREKNDTSDKMTMEFFASMIQMADGKAYDNTKLYNLDPEKLSKIKKMLPYNTYKSGFQECCAEQNSTSQDKCLNEIFMEMIYRVAIKPFDDNQDFQNVGTNQNSSDEEEFVRKYIKNRLEIGTDIDELERRWGESGEVSRMSSESTYFEFQKRYAEGLIKVAKEEGLTRKIEISNVRREPRSDGQKVWVADAILIDVTSSNGSPRKTDLRITILLKDTSGPTKFQVDGWGQKYMTTPAQRSIESNIDVKRSDTPITFTQVNISKNAFLKKHIINNPDIKNEREECTKYTVRKPCIMYVSNTSGQEQLAENFFDEVAKKMDRASYLIRIENQQYAKKVIPVGKIAEISVPALR